MNRIILTIIGAGVALAMLGGCAEVAHSPAAVIKGSAETESRSEKLANDIRFHQERVKGDPNGAIGWAMLSEAYLAQAREADDDEAAAWAEDAARKSLELREVNNSRAAMRLVASLLAQHRFAEAEVPARLAVRLSNSGDMEIRHLGEVLLELGHYDEFRAVIGEHSSALETADGRVLWARWNELIGQTGTSISAMKSAISMAESAGPTGADVLASYQAALGWIRLRSGDIVGAEAEFNRAITGNPRDRKARSGLVRVAYERSDWNEVLARAARARTTVRMTDVMGWEVLALNKLGRTAEADTLTTEILAINDLTRADLDHSVSHRHGSDHSHEAEEGRHTHSRLLATFLADAGKHLQYAHHAAEEDLGFRTDIHAYDAFAWATYRFWLLDPVAQKEGDGLLREAQAAIKMAMATGTRDREILKHSQEIMAAKPRNN